MKDEEREQLVVKNRWRENWNKMSGCECDIATLIVARDVELTKLKLNMVMLEWKIAVFLLAKNTIVALTKKRFQTILPLHVWEELSRVKTEWKIIKGFDSELCFWEQICQTEGKAEKGITVLNRLIPMLLDKSPTYGLISQIWYISKEGDVLEKYLVQVQRRGTLRVASGYLIVSELVFQLLLVLFALLARECQTIYRRKREVNMRLQQKRRDDRCPVNKSFKWTIRLMTKIKV